MKDSEISNVEYMLADAIEKVRAKTVVTVKNLDFLEEVMCRVYLKVEELRRSRDKWRERALAK